MSDAPVTVISGGSRGLGLALTRYLLDRGHRVATFSRSETDELTELRKSVGEDRLFWSRADATDPDAVQDFAAEVTGRFHRIDALINNAATGLDGLLTLTRAEDITRTLEINLTGPVLLTRACVKPMIARRGGCVINVSSINALRGQPGVAVYSAAKAALDGLTRSLARELGPAGIRVVGVAPGYFDSEMTEGMSADLRRRVTRRTPLGRLGDIGDLLGVFGFLLSDDARFITGVTVPVDGGFTC
ncbi:SDR family NAD(P)-dependent oxidoreductase [Actinoplanes sp. CA-252034]|uniref:SDR family NAD(P)-dependent oxidoreductase n=1 Tax=Actinoplanes sp. CA-252034 TaxID=3239906 RepID=UPI003D9832A2